MFLAQLQKRDSQVLFQQNQQPSEREEVFLKSEVGGDNAAGSPVTENEKILSLEKAILLSQNESLRAQVELVRTRSERELRTLREQALGTLDLREENKKLLQRVVFLERVLRRVGLKEAELWSDEACAPVICPMGPKRRRQTGRNIEEMPALETSPEGTVPQRVTHSQLSANVSTFKSRTKVNVKRSLEDDERYSLKPDLKRKRLKQRKNIPKSPNSNRQPSIKKQVLYALRRLKMGGTHIDVKNITFLLTKKQVQRALSELNCSHEAKVIGKRANEGYIYKATGLGTCLDDNGMKSSKLAPRVNAVSLKLDVVKSENAVQSKKLSPTASLTSTPIALKLRPPSLQKAVKLIKPKTSSNSKISPTSHKMSAEKPNPSTDITFAS